jgi:hypothetical protein
MIANVEATRCGRAGNERGPAIACSEVSGEVFPLFSPAHPSSCAHTLLAEELDAKIRKSFENYRSKNPNPIFKKEKRLLRNISSLNYFQI